MPMNVSQNGDITLDEAGQQQAASFFESLEAVNLDEVTTTTIRVGLRDFRIVQDIDDEGNYIIENGQKKMRREFYNRTALIQNYVPMLVLNQMMAARKRVLRLRQEYINDPQGENVDPMLNWMLEQVLVVWQVSEPDMTLEHLGTILPFEKMSRLFTLFFGHLFQTMRI